MLIGCSASVSLTGALRGKYFGRRRASAGFAGCPRTLSFLGRPQNSQRRASGPPPVLLEQLRACIPKNDRVLGSLNVAQNTYPASRLLVSQFGAFRPLELKGWTFSDAVLRIAWSASIIHHICTRDTTQSTPRKLVVSHAPMQFLGCGVCLGRALAVEPGAAEGRAKARTMRTGGPEGTTASVRPRHTPQRRNGLEPTPSHPRQSAAVKLEQTSSPPRDSAEGKKQRPLQSVKRKERVMDQHPSSQAGTD